MPRSLECQDLEPIQRESGELFSGGFMGKLASPTSDDLFVTGSPMSL